MARVSGALATAAALGLVAALVTSCDDSGSGSLAADHNPLPAATGHGSAVQSATPSAPATTARLPVPSPTGKPARGKHNQADVVFATNFITHHAQGVAMAQMLLAKAYIDPAVRALASRVKSEQGPQIERLRGWLAGFDRAVPAPNGSPTGGLGNRVGSAEPSVSGMMSAKDMAALGRLDGVEAAKLFLAMLANHEIGGIRMAYGELLTGRNGEAKKLAQTMIGMQRDLVGAANELLDGRMHPPGHY